jgi:surfactin synthase thioesterase subunit
MAASPLANPWIAHARPRSEARLRLFCFPYAGGNASIYRGWGQRLPAEVDVLPVELPGRASRFREPPCRRVAEVVEKAAAALRPLCDRPFAFFGHSMGAIIAFELARWQRRRSMAGPAMLFVSARRAPHLPDEEPPIHALPEPQMLERLRELNGTPEEALSHPELMQMLLPLLRADFELIETYACAPEEPLACPMEALGGLADTEVEREDLEAWRQHTSGPFGLRLFAGDHFFLNHEPARGQLLGALAQSLGHRLSRL